LCTCCRHYPGAATSGTTSLIRPVVSAFPGMAAGSACASSFSRFTRRSLALRPAHSRCHRISRHALPEGFSHFVTSMTAPVASGWSICRVGLAPTGKRRLITAHARSGRSLWRTRGNGSYCRTVAAVRVLECAPVGGARVPAPRLPEPSTPARSRSNVST
jgi:hypothetical protein